MSAIDNRVALPDIAVFILYRNSSVTVHDHKVALLVSNGSEVEKSDRPAVLRLQRTLLANPRCSATDVKRPHGQLRPWLSDRLGRNNTYGLTLLHQFAACQAIPVALLANTPNRLAGQYRTDLHFLKARILNLCGKLYVDLLAGRTKNVIGKWVLYIFECHATNDTITQRLDNLAALNDRRHENTLDRAAVADGHDHILRHVNKTSSQVP